ncbi:MAG: phosphoribosylamine--glycine ligase [Succinivibrionaceae bacterium]|nr:phosphoribosylamine--glycine ligase [Succinivibrionaceae bacterium]
MKVLIVGSGGREHALAYKAAQSPLCERVLVAPGNPGTAREPKVVNVPVAADDLDGLIALAQREGVDLTIVGPEAPLVAGLCDRLGAAGIRAFGPSRAAAQLEGSKSFTKEFLRRHGIPTAAYATFTDLDQAERYIKERGAPIVVKADGLAAGKGVVVAMSVDEALAAVRGMLGGHDFGAAGAKVVIEEFMEGEEASFIVMSDSVNALPMATSQDHKRAHDHDQGPNTGGMGAYSPAPVVTPEVHARVMERIIMPTIRGMAEEGMPYHGFLYAGLMVDREGNPRVVEFNCRFGDPETQPIMMRMKSDLVDLCLRGCEPGGLSGASVDYDPRPAVGVVIAAEGYPASPRKGDPITGLGGELPPGVKIFEAGTREQGGQVVTSGGRVLCATALGEDVRDARDRAYAACGTVSFPGMFYRHDIAWRALSR